MAPLRRRGHLTYGVYGYHWKALVTRPPLHPVQLGIPGTTFDAVGLRIVEPIAYEQWEAIGHHLGVLRDVTAWGLGDWILAGEALYGELSAQGVEVTGRSKTTLLEYARVARQVPRERRRPGLSFTHHQLVAAREPAEQIDWLDRAETNRWSAEELRGMLREEPALPTRQADRRIPMLSLRLVYDVALAVLRAAEPTEDGYRRVPDDVFMRLANAVDPASMGAAEAPST